MTHSILITDDEKHMLVLLRATLLPVGCQIFTASSGEEALARAATTPIDLLLIDFEMPGLNGVQTVRRLKENPRHAALPIIMITGSGHTRIRSEATGAGVSLFLQKPFSPAELLESVQQFLRLSAEGPERSLSA